MGTVVITGASGGVGLAAARALVEASHRVVLVARPGWKLEEAYRALAERAPHLVGHEAADLSRLGEVRDLAARLSRWGPIDALICNAAVVPAERRVTSEGLEESLAVNHLAPFVLVHHAQGLLAERARVVVVSADPRLLAREPVDLDDLELTRGFDGLRAYMRAKNMNAMFAFALARRWAASARTVNAVHPGILRTQLGRSIRGWAGLATRIASPFLPSARRGAETVAWLASSSEVDGVSGRFFIGRRSVACAEHVRDEARQEELWARSASLVGLSNERSRS